MFKKLLHKVVGDPTKKYLDSIQPIVDEVQALEADLEKLPDEALRNKTAEFKERLNNGDTLDDILPEAFALVRETSRRTTGMRHYDVQILGGVLLHRGEVVEMRTGEGKTLVATLPLYLNALTGDGVHLVTVNEYLARRDGGWMSKIFHKLGLTVGVIGPQRFSALYDPDYVNPGAELEDERLVHWRPCTRNEAYNADITYGISSEFGFDYLRDNMVTRREQLVHRDLNFAIIDEVDNILIDEARTPLILSGPSGSSSQEYVRFAQYVRGLKENTAEEDEEPTGHYDIDEKSRSISLTEMGIAKIEDQIPEINPDIGDSLYDPRFYQLTYYVDNALKAQYLFKRDKEYVVQNGEVIIVDDFTGRLMPGRRYSDGLHEAIEAKEGVQVHRENVTVATITLQNYFRLYEKLAGMTGTAMTDAEEFDEVYELEVTPLPTNVDYVVDQGEMGLVEKRRKVEGAEEIYFVHPDDPEKRIFAKRIDFPDRVYKDLDAKDLAIAEEIIYYQKIGRPVLVGTTSVEHSEQLHRMLTRKNIKHAVLNAKIHQSEALTVAQAGRKGAITISTNMAGRGTDILLGGNPEGMASEVLEKEMFDRQDLVKLAVVLLTDGEAKAQEFVQNNRKLTADLIPALQEVKAEFDEAMSEIENQQVIGYLTQKFQEPYNIDYSDVRHVLRLVRGGQLAEGRDHLDKIGKDAALVDEAVRLWGLYNRYERMHSDPRQAAQFVAETLFEKLYNGRAALIRVMMNNDLAAAQKLVDTIPGLEPETIAKIEDLKKAAEEERREIWELGGLHVIGSERHESRRIDNQLRGRAARQGDPGSSRFFLSVEDDLMRRFGGERLKGAMSRINMPDDMPIEAGILDRIIEGSQERIEGYNFDIRKSVVEYDDVMSKQREAIYGERRGILMGESVDLDEKVDEAFDGTIDDLIQNYIADYRNFVQGEIDRAVVDYSTDATDVVNLNGILIRLRGLLPGVVELDRAALADVSPDKIRKELMLLVQENIDEGRNLYQFLQASGRFIPLLPPIPNLGSILSGRKSGQLQARENLNKQFVEQIQKVFDDFLADHIEEAERDKIWTRTAKELDAAFAQFNVEGLSNKAIQSQQVGFFRRVDDTLRNLLVDSLSELNEEQLSEALNDYVSQQRDGWREQIGEAEHDDFQRLVLLDAIDREWRDYLIAMDDLRREIGLEAIAQRDPKVEYKRRSYQMFAEMRRNIEKNIVEGYFRRLASHQEFIRKREETVAYQERMSQAGYQVVQREKGKGSELRRDVPKVGRNDLCPCGSGKKYKSCHMRKDQAAANKGSRPVRSR